MEKSTGLVLCMLTFLLAACSNGGVTESDLRGTIRGSVRSQLGRPVFGTLVILSGPNGEQQSLTPSTGEFEFTGLLPGIYTLDINLPLGFSPLTPLPVTVNLHDRPIEEVFLILNAVTRATGRATPGIPLILALGTGTALQVEAIDGSVDVLLEDVTDEGVQGESAVTGSRLILEPLVHGQIAPAATTQVHIRLWQDMPDLLARGALFFNLGSPSAPLLMYLPSTVEQIQGGTRIAFEKTVPVAETFSALLGVVEADHSCPENLRVLREVSGGRGSLPLILVHGWQWNLLTCSSFASFSPDAPEPDAPLHNLLEFLRESDEVSARYRFYVYRYPSLDHITVNSNLLLARMQAMGLQDAVIVGHSMGGLVGRGALAGSSTAVRGLVTLGTPHQGTPAARFSTFISRDACSDIFLGSIFQTWCRGLIDWDATPFPFLDGVEDMQPGRPGVFLGQVGGSKTYTLAGRVIPSEIGNDLLRNVARLLDPFIAEDFDGIVPQSSSIPDWTNRYAPFLGYDHLEMSRGDTEAQDLTLFRTIEDLLVRLADGMALSGRVIDQFSRGGLGGLVVSFGGASSITSSDGSFRIAGTTSAGQKQLRIEGAGVYTRTTFTTGGRVDWEVIPRIFNMAAFNDVAREPVGATRRWIENPRVYIDNRARGFTPPSGFSTWLQEIAVDIPGWMSFWSNGSVRPSAIAIGSSPPVDFTAGTIVVRFDSSIRNQDPSLVATALWDANDQGEIQSALIKFYYDVALQNDRQMRQSLTIKNVGHMTGLANLEGFGPPTIMLFNGWQEHQTPTAFDSQTRAIVYSRTSGNTNPDNDRSSVLAGNMVPSTTRSRGHASSINSED